MRWMGRWGRAVRKERLEELVESGQSHGSEQSESGKSRELQQSSDTDQLQRLLQLAALSLTTRTQQSVKSRLSKLGRKAGLRIAMIGILAAVLVFVSFGNVIAPVGGTTSVETEAAGGSSGLDDSQSGGHNVALAAVVEQRLSLTETVDVAIVGSEMEGMYLARAAKDEGLSVKIIDPREAIGGQLLQAEMQFLDETRDEDGKLLPQGRSKELFDGFRSGKIRKNGEFVAYFDKLRKDIPIESGIRIERVETKAVNGSASGNATVTGAGKHSGTGSISGSISGSMSGAKAGASSMMPAVDSATAADSDQTVVSVTYRTKDGNLQKLNAAYWVDNSDFATLVSQLKLAKRLPGLEQLYKQSHIEYMSAGMMLKFKNVNWNKFMTDFNALTKEERSKQYGGGYVNESYAIGLSGTTDAYQPTSKRVRLRGLNAVYQRDGEVSINALLIYTIDPSDEKSIAEAVALGEKESPLILDHFRKKLPGWEKAELNGIPAYPYIREYNHYETDYTLNASDMLGGRMFEDNVSIAGYPLDLQGISANVWGIEMGRPDKYGMPLRSFLLKRYDNVILAGKNVGSSAVAYGSARIQPNTAQAAESIGVILGQIRGTAKKLHSLSAADWTAYHKLLEKKYRIKLTGVTGRNKLAGWTDEEIRKLDSGEIIFTTYAPKRKAK